MLKIVEKKKIWFSLSLIVVIIGLGLAMFKGLNFGIDFKGGTQVTIDFGKEFDKVEVDQVVKEYAEAAVTNTIETTQYEIKSKDLDAIKVGELFNKLKESYGLDDKALVSQDEIGASVGKDLTKSSIIALLVSFVAMLIYIAIRFELSFGIAALVALAHDILVTISIYAIFDVPINTPFIAAILTIVGYSINDTIVIFDRIRENSKSMRRAGAVEIANVSITQTMSRSINTTLTTLFTIVAVYIFVPTVREFTFPLSIGIACGAFSSIFIASPIWSMLDGKLKHKIKSNR